jgi:RNA polymerase-binding transcription factor DksA
MPFDAMESVLCVKEVVMKRSTRSMRRVVLCRMFDLLEQTYGIDVDREEFVGERVSLHEIDAALAFKSDPRLEELRGALERIDDGSFGVCIGCKTDIEERLLDDEPARRMCQKCEKEYNRSSSVSMEAHLLH